MNYKSRFSDSTENENPSKRVQRPSDKSFTCANVFIKLFIIIICNFDLFILKTAKGVFNLI